MYFGTTNIKEQFFGDTPIKSVWLGTTQVWSAPYTYQISDVSFVYSTDDGKILCDGSNYGYASCTLKTYSGSTLVKTETNKRMNVAFNYSTIGEYFTVDDTNKIWFNMDDYGTRDMSTHNDPLTTSLTPYINGLTGDTLYLYLQPNLLTGTTNLGYDITNTLNRDFLLYNQISLTLRNKSVHTVKNSYKSGKSATVSTGITEYIYSASTNTQLASITYNSSTSFAYEVNNTGKPILYSYRATYSSAGTYTSSDEYIYIMQASSTRASTMQLYWNDTLLGDDYTIQQSTDVILMNDSHTADTTYDFDTDDQALIITQKGGVIYIDGVTSSTDCYVDIIANETDIITINILGA